MGEGSEPRDKRDGETEKGGKRCEPFKNPTMAMSAMALSEMWVERSSLASTSSVGH